MIARYKVDGAPIALQRARCSHMSQTVYDPQRKEKERVAYEILSQRSHSVISGPVELYIRFFFPISPKYSVKKQQYLSQCVYTSKPDLSNCIKFLEDVCNNVLFDDDRLITYVTAHKSYSYTPRTEFVVVAGNDHGRP